MFDCAQICFSAGWWCGSSTNAEVPVAEQETCVQQPQAASTIAGGGLQVVPMCRTRVAIDDEGRHAVAQRRVAGDRNGQVEAEGDRDACSMQGQGRGKGGSGRRHCKRGASL